MQTEIKYIVWEVIDWEVELEVQRLGLRVFGLSNIFILKKNKYLKRKTRGNL